MNTGSRRNTFLQSNHSRRVAARLASIIRGSSPGLPEALETRRLFSALPTGYQDADVGTVGLAGSASYDVPSGTFTVNGAGSDIYGAADGFNFAYATLTGNGAFIAHVTSATPTMGNSPTGIDLRSSLDPAAANMFAAVNGNGSTFVNDRTSDGGTGSNLLVQSGDAPLWLELIRTGNSISSYESSDGTNYTLLATDTFQNLPTTVFVGLAVASHDTTSLATGTFDHVSLTPYGAPPAGYQESDIGVVGTPGSSGYDSANGVFNVSGAGNDIFGSDDAFHYVYTPLTGNGSFVVEQTQVIAADSTAPSGIDLRSSLASDAANMFLADEPGGDVIVNDRTTDGGTGGNLLSSSNPLPSWLKLTRSGDTVTAFTSSDGTNFTQVATDTLTLGSTVYVGLAVASHDPSTLAIASFQNVSLVGTDAPTATLTTAPTVTEVSSSPYDFTVTYGDNFGVNASTLSDSNLVVTGPGGYSQTATLVTTGLTNNTTLAATYSVPTPVTDGTYTVTANANSVFNVSSLALAAGAVGTFTVSIPIDAVAPTATLSDRPPVTSATAPYVFSVTYTDNLGVEAAGLSNNNILVTGPNGYSQLATLLTTGLTDGPSLTAQYSVPAPSASGTYTISMQANQVIDLSGNPVAAGSLGTINSSFTPGAQLSNAPTITTTRTTPYPFTVTYSGALPINTSTFGNGNVTVTGPGGYSQAATFVSSGGSEGNSFAANYTVPAPTVNGTYTVTLNSSQVSDTSNNPVSGGVVGTFVQNVPIPGSIAGSVVSSLNNTGIAGRTLTLSTGATAVTDSNGNFSFANVIAGTYTVTETLPTGVVSTDPTSDIRTVVVTAGAATTGVTFANLPAPAATGPDLTATLVSKTPSAVVGGSAGTMVVKITNIGSAIATGTGSVSLLISPSGLLSASNTVVATASTGALKLKTNASKTLSIKFTYPTSLASGSYKLIGVANSTDSIAETNFANNSASSSAITIAPAFTSLAGQITKTPKTLVHGKSGSATVTVTNSGNVASTASLSISLYESPVASFQSGDILLGTLTRPRNNIKASGGKTSFPVNFKVPSTVTSGNEFIVAVLNGDTVNAVASPTTVAFS